MTTDTETANRQAVAKRLARVLHTVDVKAAAVPHLHRASWRLAVKAAAELDPTWKPRHDYVPSDATKTLIAWRLEAMEERDAATLNEEDAIWQGLPS